MELQANSTGSGSGPALPRKRRLFPPPLPLQVLVGVALGVFAGVFGRALTPALEVLGKLFLNLVEMMLVPLLFPMVALSIAGMGSFRRLGRLAGKSILYFELATTVILLIGLAIGNLTNVGASVSVDRIAKASTEGIAHGIDFKKFFLEAVPNNIFAAFSANHLLAVIVFGVIFGIAMSAAGERAALVKNTLESVSQIMVRAISQVVRLSPIGVFGYVGYAVATYGFSLLLSLGQFIVVVYVGCLALLVVLFPLIAVIFRVRYVWLLRSVSDLVVIAYVTRSTEAVLAPLLERLERIGVRRDVVSFTLPLGYSFNADGSALYSSIAMLFVAHAFHVPMNIGQQLVAVGVLVVLTKGIAGVPSSSIVVLLAASQAIGLPAAGVAVLLAVDFVVDMARAAVNIVGNSLATVVIAKTEQAFAEHAPVAA
ncbi:dicarboxylate/amino acid:cation symporter [Amycolatopsis sp. NPDC059090]|uniref:dicarboxylate/amino acid:cation symporter n=1 Tax=Amycolatopsis sp. NPDC059090 TaxID=3346723 RepID=UPI003671D4AE